MLARVYIIFSPERGIYWQKLMRYILIKIFYDNFLQLAPIFVATWQYHVEKKTLIWQRFNHWPIFALLQHCKTVYQPNRATSAWKSGNQKALYLVGTLGVGELPIWPTTVKTLTTPQSHRSSLQQYVVQIVRLTSVDMCNKRLILF